MRTLPYKILNPFGIVISKEEYETRKLKYKEAGKVDIYFHISEVHFGFSDGNYTTLYLTEGRRYVICKGFSEVCLLFPINFFDCFNRGQMINKTKILSHTGRYQHIVSIFLPHGFIFVVSDSQRSRFLNFVDNTIAITEVTKAIQKLLTKWEKKGRAVKIENWPN